MTRAFDGADEEHNLPEDFGRLLAGFMVTHLARFVEGDLGYHYHYGMGNGGHREAEPALAAMLTPAGVCTAGSKNYLAVHVFLLYMGLYAGTVQPDWSPIFHFFIFSHIFHTHPLPSDQRDSSSPQVSPTPALIEELPILLPTATATNLNNTLLPSLGLLNTDFAASHFPARLYHRPGSTDAQIILTLSWWDPEKPRTPWRAEWLDQDHMSALVSFTAALAPKKRGWFSSVVSAVGGFLSATSSSSKGETAMILIQEEGFPVAGAPREREMMIGVEHEEHNCWTSTAFEEAEEMRMPLQLCVRLGPAMSSSAVLTGDDGSSRRRMSSSGSAVLLTSRSRGSEQEAEGTDAPTPARNRTRSVLFYLRGQGTLATTEPVVSVDLHFCVQK